MIYNQYTPINSGNVTVPADFLGLGMISWPSTGAVAGTVYQPTPIQYKTVINDAWQIPTTGSGFSPSAWCTIETSSGVFDFSKLDVYVAQHYANGINVCFQNLWIPSFYSTNPAQAQSGLPGYLGVGGPLNAAGSGTTFSAGVSGGLYNFVFTTVKRYKDRGTPIKYWNSWIEPLFNVIPGTNTWWGTAGQMVDLAYWTYLAAKAADPNITVIGPSCFDSSGNPSTSVFWTTTGTVNTGIQGYQTFDEYGVDFYNIGPINTSFNLLTSDPYYHLKNPYDIQSWVKTLRTGMGANVKPLAFTNFGSNDSVGAGNIAFSTYIRSQPALWRKQFIARSLLTLTALGITRAYVWNYDYYAWTSSNSNFYFFDFVNDTSGALAGFNEIAQNVVGKTITFCGYAADGSMIATFSDGTSYTI